MPKVYEAPKREDQLPQGVSWVSEKVARYQIIADRYVGDAVVKASPEVPAVITLPAGSKIDFGMTELKEGQEVQPVKLGSFHAGEAIKRRGSAAHFGKITKANAEEQAE